MVIVSGKNHDSLVELEVDSNQLVLHSIGIDTKTTLNDNIELLQQHCGEGKSFPGLPNCKFKGIKIPGYLTFTESGGITAEILTKIFRKMDNLSLFNNDCDAEMVPFICLGGHGSRFDVNLLEYINDKSHKWNVCLVASGKIIQAV